MRNYQVHGVPEHWRPGAQRDVTVENLARALGVHRTVVHRAARSMGITHARGKPWSAAQARQIIEWYAQHGGQGRKQPRAASPLPGPIVPS